MTVHITAFKHIKLAHYGAIIDDDPVDVRTGDSPDNYVILNLDDYGNCSKVFEIDQRDSISMTITGAWFRELVHMVNAVDGGYSWTHHTTDFFGYDIGRLSFGDWECRIIIQDLRTNRPVIIEYCNNTISSKELLKLYDNLIECFYNSVENGAVTIF